jgi:hypothetical protein
MKLVILAIVTAFTLSAHTKKSFIQEEVELICTKKHSTTNSCHYNFKIGGINYHYTDIGCKGKRDSIIKKAKEGKLGLAKDWKIPCPESKEKASD